MKNSNDTVGNQSQDLPVCSTVSQPLRHRMPTNRNEYQEYLLRAKDGRCVRLTTLPLSCADYLKIWEPSGPVQDCNKLALSLCTEVRTCSLTIATFDVLIRFYLAYILEIFNKIVWCLKCSHNFLLCP
jgi:hypothetical protein